MIVYLDTSAIVPILIAEATSDICREIWEGASRRASLRLTYIETAAALSMAERRQRITPEEHDRAWANFLAIWPDVDVIDLTKDSRTAPPNSREASRSAVSTPLTARQPPRSVILNSWR